MKIKLGIGANVLSLLTGIAVAAVTILFVGTSSMVNAQNELWTSSFNIGDCNFSTRGTNPYFVLQPGYQLVFAGVEDGEPLRQKLLEMG